MIVRVLRLTVRPGKVGAFNVLFRRQVPLLKEQPGLVYVKLARRLQPDGSEDVVLFEEWRDAGSLYAWVGADLMAPRLIPGARELIDELVVAHYEALDKDHDEAPVWEWERPADESPTRDDGAPTGAGSQTDAERQVDAPTTVEARSPADGGSPGAMAAAGNGEASPSGRS